MNKETKEILQRVILDVGYWKQWNQEEEKIQIEFGAVLLFDDTKKTERQEQAIQHLFIVAMHLLFFQITMSRTDGLMNCIKM